MKLTSNLSLKKPDGNDVVNIDDFNYNADKIDTEIQGLKTGKAPTIHTHAMSDVGITTSSAVNSTSTTTIANSYAVKQAYDKGNVAEVQAETNKNNIASQGVIVTNQGKEIESLKQSVVDGKTKVAKAISDKKIPTLATDTFDKMATNIASIKASPQGWDLEEQGEVMEGDIIENDAIVWQKYGDWEKGIEPLLTQPKQDFASIDVIATSSSGKFVAIGGRPVGSASYDAKVYKRNGDSFVDTGLAIDLGTGSVSGFAFSTDETQLFMASNSPYITSIRLFQIKDDVFTEQSITWQDGIISGTTKGMCISNDNRIISAGTMTNTDDVSIGFRVPNTLATFRKAILYTAMGGSTAITISADSKLIAVGGHGSTTSYGYYALFSVEGEQITKLVTTSTGTGRVYAMSFSPDSNYLAMSGYSGTEVYKRTPGTSTYTKLPALTPGVNVATCYGNSFSSDGMYLSIACVSAPYVFTFKRDGDTFTKIANPKVLPTKSCEAISFSQDGKHQYVGNSGATPFLVYRTETKNIVSKFSVPNYTLPKLSNKKIGYAMESKKNGEQIKVNLFPKLNIL